MRILKRIFNFAVTAVVAVASMTISTFARSQSPDLIVCGDNETRATNPDHATWIGPIKKISWESSDKENSHDNVINFDKSRRVTSVTKKHREGSKINADEYRKFSYDVGGKRASSEYNEINSDTRQLKLRVLTEISKISDGFFQIQTVTESPLDSQRVVRSSLMKEIVIDDDRTRQICVQIGKVVDRKNRIADIYTNHQNLSVSAFFESQYPIVDINAARDYINKLDKILPSTDPVVLSENSWFKYIFHSDGYDSYYDGKFNGRFDMNGRPLFYDTEDGREVYIFKNDNRGNWIEKRVEKVSNNPSSKIQVSIEKRKIEYYE